MAKRKKMREKDWVIARLLYALTKNGINISESDVIKSMNWFTDQFGTTQLLDAYEAFIDEGKKTYPQNWRYNGESR